MAAEALTNNGYFKTEFEVLALRVVAEPRSPRLRSMGALNIADMIKGPGVGQSWVSSVPVSCIRY